MVYVHVKLTLVTASNLYIGSGRTVRAADSAAAGRERGSIGTDRFCLADFAAVQVAYRRGATQ